MSHDGNYSLCLLSSHVHCNVTEVCEYFIERTIAKGVIGSSIYIALG